MHLEEITEKVKEVTYAATMYIRTCGRYTA